MTNPFDVVRQFEQAVAEYTGAPHVVAVNSCSMALTLAMAWHIGQPEVIRRGANGLLQHREIIAVEIPKRTYVSVPQSIIHAGGWPKFRDEEWLGAYQLKPLPVWDSARWFTSGLYRSIAVDLPHRNAMVCVSFHASKTLGFSQGGAILHNSPGADEWLRRARFDGRREGVAPRDDTFDMPRAFHCYMSPDVAAGLLLRLHSLPRHNAPLPNDDYPDLSAMEIFR